MTLPRYASSFVGRQRELASLGEAIARGARLVTLVGLGGIGKTRLALAFAGGRAALYCDLSAARTTADLCDAVARTLDVRTDAARPLDAPLARRIGDEIARRDRPLLVLDNFEQLGMEQVAMLDAWRAREPAATFVVTSRRPLGTRGEVVLPIAPLERGQAVDLFIARAAHRLHGADAIERALPLVEEVVARLEGIPLAIELAAARLDLLPLGAIAEGLSARFRMLRDPLSADERQATLWRAIDGSWRLLAPWQRAALAQLTVFEASFAIEDAAAVVALPHARAADAPTVLDALHALVRQGLARVDVAGEPGAARFALFETVRDFAARSLDAPKARLARKRHARWFIARGREAAEALDTRGALDGLQRLDRDRADLTAVLRRALAVEPPTRASSSEASSALLALAPLLAVRGSAETRLPLFDAAIRAAERAGGRGPDDAWLALGRAQSLRQLGRLDEALAVIDRALAEARAARAPRVEGRLLEEASYARAMQGRLEEARAHAEEAAALFRTTGDVRHEGIAHVHHALANVDLGELDAAIAHTDRARDLFRAVGASIDEGAALLVRGIAAFESRDVTSARACFERAAAIHGAAGERRQEARARGYLGGIAHDAGELDAARDAYDRARCAFAEVGERRLEAIYVGYVGLVDVQRGDLEGGVPLLVRARDALAGVGDARYLATMEAALAGVRALGGDVDGAAEELARLEPSLAAHGSPSFVRLVDVYRGVVRIMSGDREGARAASLELARVPADDVRLALPLLRRLLREADDQARAWTVDPRGGAFRAPDGDVVSLETRVPLTRLLAALARERIERPGEPLSKDRLARVAWPDEARLEAASANNRLKVAVSTLRKVGLDPLLLTRAGGYLFDPDVPIRIASAIEPLEPRRRAI